ncbi:alanine racemase [uncultured Parasphingopyxis sp.]|uniref:alanine racemase n=1 Tax=uncultured Parasphingopyxis sp. TaxID=1547918 RepID=UPI00261CA583|nr:alanine racemase [uncultured Parasphingopyxis sp.]
MAILEAPLRLRLDGDALARNWRALDRLSGDAACGAAVKADGYGLGVTQVVPRLIDAGCRDFFVATWAEALEIAEMTEGLSLTVFHGVRAADMPTAKAGHARPCLNSPEQVQRWQQMGGAPCDVMVDTGMNRLGLTPEQVSGGILKGLNVHTLMSHLACSDEPSHPLNRQQREALAWIGERASAKRLSLANSAGVALGGDYAFGLTRPGLSLYGGIQVPRLENEIASVVAVEAEVIQRRTAKAGETVGYGATFRAPANTELAILHIGYADGYLRGFSGSGMAHFGEVECPVVGRVSMDLIAVSVDACPQVAEGDWIAVDYDLPTAAAQSGLSQYELLTGLGRRYQRLWI